MRIPGFDGRPDWLGGADTPDVDGSQDALADDPPADPTPADVELSQILSDRGASGRRATEAGTATPPDRPPITLPRAIGLTSVRANSVGAGSRRGGSPGAGGPGADGAGLRPTTAALLSALLRGTPEEAGDAETTPVFPATTRPSTSSHLGIANDAATAVNDSLAASLLDKGPGPSGVPSPDIGQAVRAYAEALRGAPAEGQSQPGTLLRAPTVIIPDGLAARIAIAQASSMSAESAEPLQPDVGLPPLSRDGVLETVGPQMVRAVLLMWRSGVAEARVRLEPEHLGSLTIALRVDRGVVSASVAAARVSAGEQILEHEADLRKALAEQGLDLDRIVVTADPDEGRAGRRSTERRDTPRQERRAQPQAAFELGSD